MDDLNYQLKVSAKPDVDGGLSAVEQRFEKSRRAMERPIESGLNFDTKPLELAERNWAKFRKSLESPIKLQVDSSAIEAATKRMASAGARPGFVPRSGGGELALANDPIGLKSIATTRDRFEQQVRDNMASIIRGMKKRADAENAIANRARAELEARGRLGLYTESARTLGREVSLSEMSRGDINGPAVRGRFSAAEAAARSRQAAFLRSSGRGMDADSRAVRYTRGGSADAAERAYWRDSGLSNGYGGGGFVASDNRPGRSGRAGGGGGGGRGDILRTLANTLPGLGPAGVILMGLNAVANAPEIIKNTRTNVQNFGAVGGLATSLGESIGVGDISRNIRQTFESVVSPNMAKAERRRFEAEDARRTLEDQIAAKRERDNAFITPLLAGLGSSVRGNRQASELIGLKDEFDIRRVQLRQGYENDASGFDDVLRQARFNKVGGAEMQALEKSVADARIAASDKYQKEVAELEKELIKRNADLMRDAQIESVKRSADLSQELLQAQGKTLEATIDRITFQANSEVDATKRALEKAANDYGVGSPQYRAALQARSDAEMSAYQRRDKLVPLAMKQDFEDSRGRFLGARGAIDSATVADLRRRGQRSGDPDLLSQADRFDILGQFKQQYETLRQITVAQNADESNKRDAESIIRDLPNQLRDALNDTMLSRVTGRDLANATFARADSGVGKSGFGLSTRENFLAMGGKTDASKTAENTAKLVALFEQFIRKAIGADDPVSIFFDN